MPQDYVRQIQALEHGVLEEFIDHWISHKAKNYVSTQIWGGSGDKGRDVVGFLSLQRFEGPWHLYQSKQLKDLLRLPDALKELAKVFFHAAADDTSLPAAYYFIAPHGVARAVMELVGHPSQFRAAMIAYCAKNAVGQPAPLAEKIRSLIEGFDFGMVHILDVHAILRDPHIGPTLLKYIGFDPGAYPSEGTPDEPKPEEARYLGQLVKAYAERAKEKFPDVTAVLQHGEFGAHLWDQRTRYFEAAYFKRHYRDNTSEEHLVDFAEQIYHGVVGTYRADYRDTLARIEKVTDHAVSINPASILTQYARVQVKQGFCHHFANEGRLPWKP